MLNRTKPVMIAIAALVLAPMPALAQQNQSSEVQQDRHTQRQEEMAQLRNERMTERMSQMAQRMAEMQKRGEGANGYPGQMGNNAGQRGTCQGMNGQGMQQGQHKGMGRNAEGRAGVQQRAGPPQLQPDSPSADE